MGTPRLPPCAHGRRWYRCPPCRSAYYRSWFASLSADHLARRRLQDRDDQRRRAARNGTARPERHRPSKYDGATAPATCPPCPSCGSVRTEVARTRTAPVLLCWRCGGRFATAVAS